VVWPEAANLLLPEEERELTWSMARLAREREIELVVSYIMPVSFAPLRYENRARWFAPDGSERAAYLKYHPVPGEPAVPGEAPAPALHTRFGLASLAICYDYDFPALARTHARSGAGLVAIPASDWRGDPIHSEMAAMRAIEGGFSIARATRFGLSAGIDAHGRLRGQQSTNESGEPYVMVSLPSTRIATPYAALGNWVLAPLIAVLGWAAVALAAGRRRRARPLSAATAARQVRGV
jgi:apolipoprotein N-acyltransferase